MPAPEVGFLWTPGYWAWGGRGFIFYEGYWSYQVVGFYGGINYGHGYFGRGFEGGHWDNGRFFYNRSVNNVDVTIIHNVYEAPVNIRNASRVSHNGGEGGIDARPTSQEEAAAHARHLSPVPVQTQHFQAARSNPQLRASVNHGKPPIAATPKPSAFDERGVVSAREAGAVHGGPSNAGRGNAQPGNNNSSRATAVHPNELPPVLHPGPPDTGNPKRDQEYRNSKKRCMRSRRKNGKSFNNSRKRNIRNSQNTMRMRPTSGRSSSNISSRPNNYSKSTPNNSRSCRKKRIHTRSAASAASSARQALIRHRTG